MATEATGDLKKQSDFYSTLYIIYSYKFSRRQNIIRMSVKRQQLNLKQQMQFQINLKPNTLL